mmetsp:Transcript_3953/g.17610  ORF Transcript_3953/g.17610 Transcript_3953/m.17610 type:complete len:220 (-) Transcript_3953:319-978(-)
MRYPPTSCTAAWWPGSSTGCATCSGVPASTSRGGPSASRASSRKDPWRPRWISRTGRGAGVRAVGIFSRTGSTRRARGKPPTPPRLPRGVSRRRPANNPWTRRPTPRGRPRSSMRAPTRRWHRRGATNNMRWSRRRTRPPRNNTRNNNTRNNPGPSRKTRRRRPRRRGGRSPRCPAPSRTRRAARLPSPRSNRAGTCTTRTPGTTRMRRPACGTTPTRV